MPESSSLYEAGGSGQDRKFLQLVVDNKHKGSGSSPHDHSVWTQAVVNNTLSRKSKVENKHDAQTMDVAHNKLMDTPTRHELDARLETIEARMDARVAGMSAKLDIALAEMRADREANNVRFVAVSESIKDIKEQSKTLKSNIWFAAATIIASVLAAWALAFSAFDSGRETSKSIAEATAQMKQLQMQLEAQAKAAGERPAPTPAPQQ